VKRKRVLVIGTACAFTGVVVLIACLSGPNTPEPEYRGKKITKWLYPCIMAHAGSEAATNAVQALGTNALPWMLEGIAYEPGEFRKFLRRLPKPLNQLHTNRDVRRFEALLAFAILKGTAQPAVLQLAKWASTPTRSDRKIFARAALSHMGREDVRQWLDDLQSDDYRIRSMATNQLMAVVPELLGGAVTNKNR
jgi:hypothetical protein